MPSVLAVAHHGSAVVAMTALAKTHIGFQHQGFNTKGFEKISSGSRAIIVTRQT